MRLYRLSALIVLLTGCVDGNSSKLLAVDGFMRHSMFSADGSKLIALVAHARQNPEDPDLVSEIPDSVMVWEVGTWEKLFEHTPSGTSRIWRAYTCGDPDVIIHSWDDYPVSETQILIWRSMSTGAELGRLEVAKLPGYSEWGNSFCDVENNILYMDVGHDRIVGVDGRNGQVLREYEVGLCNYFREIWVQGERDRLIVVDGVTSTVFVFRLSSGELIDSVEIWPVDKVDGQPISMDLVDDDHLLYLIAGTNESGSGVHFFSVDLNAVQVQSSSLLEGFTLSWSSIMDPESGTVLVSVYRPSEYDGYLMNVEYSTGTILNQLDMAWHGQGQVLPIPSLGKLYIDDWSVSKEAKARVYSYPDFALLHEGRSPNDSEEKRWVESGQFIVMESIFSNSFGVYDPVRFRVVEDFHLCTEVAANSLSVDPSERWAAVMCHGDLPNDPKPGAKTKGAGVAIVDLDRYR